MPEDCQRHNVPEEEVLNMQGNIHPIVSGIVGRSWSPESGWTYDTVYFRRATKLEKISGSSISIIGGIFVGLALHHVLP